MTKKQLAKLYDLINIRQQLREIPSLKAAADQIDKHILKLTNQLTQDTSQ